MHPEANRRKTNVGAFFAPNAQTCVGGRPLGAHVRERRCRRMSDQQPAASADCFSRCLAGPAHGLGQTDPLPRKTMPVPSCILSRSGWRAARSSVFEEAVEGQAWPCCRRAAELRLASTCLPAVPTTVKKEPATHKSVALESPFQGGRPRFELRQLGRYSGVRCHPAPRSICALRPTPYRT